MRNTPRVPDEQVNLPDEHPLREVSVLVVGVVVVVVVLVAAVGLFADVAASWVSAETEREIFEPFLPSMIEALESEGVDEHAGPELQALLDRVAGVIGPVAIPLEGRVLCTEVPNALALPGGAIGVTSGLLRALETENQLAFVLGHEVGHFLHRDHLRSLGRSVGVGIILQAVLAVAAVNGDDLVEAATEGASRAHDRGQEVDADRSGLDTLIALYGHAGGGQEVLATLAELGHESWVDALDFTRTHPVGDRRLRALRDRIAERGVAPAGAQVPLSDRLRLACGEAADDEGH